MFDSIGGVMFIQHLALLLDRLNHQSATLLTMRAVSVPTDWQFRRSKNQQFWKIFPEKIVMCVSM